MQGTCQLCYRSQALVILNILFQINVIFVWKFSLAFIIGGERHLYGSEFDFSLMIFNTSMYSAPGNTHVYRHNEYNS